MTRKRHQKSKPKQQQWYKLDLHIHTPASTDYQQPEITYLDILKEAEHKGIDIIALADHNTVNGYKRMLQEIEELELLERLGRLNPEEQKRLKEYHRLSDKIVILTGFEFTATFGFHILGIFPSDTPVRDLEFLLLQLNIPADKLDQGATDVGATTDVLNAYRIINEAGGIVIAAHANSTHGVALQGLSFGGQTRIAFTQDPNLHALEVTDLEKRGKKTTARFFDGSKPEYPRRMHCIQGSDAHRLKHDTNNHKNLGLGERVTEILLQEPTFEEIKAVFLGNDFARTRPYRPESHPFDYIQSAREEGPNIVQEFHERYSKRGGYLDAIVADVGGFANTNGGTLYIGVPADPRKPPTGIGSTTKRVTNHLSTAIETSITPALPINVDVQESQSIKIARITVPRGPEPPYVVDESKIYIRSEAETTLAVRDEIVELVKRGLNLTSPGIQETHEQTSKGTDAASKGKTSHTPPPRTGVEIAAIENRKGINYYIMRDLRNGSLVKNVTRKSARRLWRYAIEQAEGNPVVQSQIHWMGDIGLWKRREHGNLVRYDLVQRVDNDLRVYYGVTEEGLHGDWNTLVGE